MKKGLILQLAFTPFLIGGIYFGFLSIRFMFINGISIFGITNLLASFIVFYGARVLPKRLTEPSQKTERKDGD